MKQSSKLLTGTMVKQSRAALLPTNLPHLQNLVKRNPGSYKEEFLQQWQHYQSSYAIFLLRPDEEGQHFIDLAKFISQVHSPSAFKLRYLCVGCELLSRSHRRISRPDCPVALSTSRQFVPWPPRKVDSMSSSAAKERSDFPNKVLNVVKFPELTVDWSKLCYPFWLQHHQKPCGCSFSRQPSRHSKTLINKNTNPPLWIGLFKLYCFPL